MTAVDATTEPEPASDHRASAAASVKNSILSDFMPIAIVAGLLALIPLKFMDSRSMMTVLISGMLFAAYGIAFNIIFGSTGQLFLCVGALAGIGGFSSAIMADRFDVPWILSILIAGVIASLVGGLLSWIAVSRSLDTIFIGIVTLAFSLSFENFVLGKGEWTGGEDGLRVAASNQTFMREQVKPYYIFLALVIVYLIFYRLLQRSHMGWAFKALKDDEVAAELAGVNVTKYRVYAGLIGSGMLGIAGAMFAHQGRGFIGSTTYAFGAVDVRVLVMLAFGGIGSLLGPILGAFVFTILDELLDSQAQLREVLYGIVTVFLFLAFRRGAIPSLSSLFKKKSTDGSG